MASRRQSSAQWVHDSALTFCWTRAPLYVVLPASMMSGLGLNPVSPVTTTVHTANGKLKAQVGRLAVLKVGRETVSGLAVVFIEDQRLRAKPLLGMRVLKSYRPTTGGDNQITLSRRH